MEVAAARQLSKYVSASLPSSAMLPRYPHAEAKYYTQGSPTFIPAHYRNTRAPDEAQGQNATKQSDAATMAHMSQLQQQVHEVVSSVRQLEANQTAATSSNSSIAQVLARIERTEQQIQQLQASPAASATKQQMRQHMQSWQEQELPQHLQPSQHQVRFAKMLLNSDCVHLLFGVL